MNRTNKRRNKNSNRQNNSSYRLVVPKSLDSFMPQSVETTLKYIDANVVKNNAGQQYIYWRMRMNDLSDPDPLILSGNVSGFAEMSTLYRRYLAISLTITTSIINRETFPVSIQSCPSDLDLSLTVTSPTQALNLGEYPQASKTHVLSAAGGMDRIEYSRTIDLPTFTGQRGAYRDSLVYGALNNASPATILFWNWSVTSATNLVLGIEQRTVYHYRCLWTQRQVALA